MTRHGNGSKETILGARGTYLSIKRNQLKNEFVERKLLIVKVASQHTFVHISTLKIYGNQPVPKVSEYLYNLNVFIGCISDVAIVSSRNSPIFGCFLVL